VLASICDITIVISANIGRETSGYRGSKGYDLGYLIGHQNSFGFNRREFTLCNQSSKFFLAYLLVVWNLVFIASRLL